MEWMTNDDYEILDDRDEQVTVRLPDGSIDIFSKANPETKLLFDHDLWDVLQTGERSLTFAWGRADAGDTLHLIPREDGPGFRLTIDPDEPVHTITLGEQHVPNVIEALAAAYTEPPASEVPDPQPIVDLYQSYQENRCRQDVLASIAGRVSLFQGVDVTDDGWLFNDHLLLDYEAEFYHPGTTSRVRSGSVVDASAANCAYDLRIEPAPSDEPIVVDGTSVLLTNIEQAFLTRAVWAAINAPDTRPPRRDRLRQHGRREGWF